MAALLSKVTGPGVQDAGMRAKSRQRGALLFCLRDHLEAERWYIKIGREMDVRSIQSYGEPSCRPFHFRAGIAASS